MEDDPALDAAKRELAQAPTWEQLAQARLKIAALTATR